MKIEQRRWMKTTGWESRVTSGEAGQAQVVFLFSSPTVIQDKALLEEIRAAYPLANVLGCSTAGEIYDTQVTDESIVSTAIFLEHSTVKFNKINMNETSGSYDAGRKLASSFDHDNLTHVFVLSDGLSVNGSELVDGITSHLPTNVPVTGGLSGDGARFQETYVLWQGVPERDAITAVGFYGERLKIGYSSLGGWDPFGPERLITRSAANVLYELDGKSALELYKKYLGEHAQGLPATGLLFPLSLRTHEGETGVVRTVLSVNEKDQSMTFAGNLPEGAYARFMKANFDRLIDGAAGAAKTCFEALENQSPDLAILISCVGRKMVLDQRVEEEVEGVREVLGQKSALTGFYSYGEISPFSPGAKCELHNQTMTITTILEK